MPNPPPFDNVDDISKRRSGAQMSFGSKSGPEEPHFRAMAMVARPPPLITSEAALTLPFQKERFGSAAASSSGTTTKRDFDDHQPQLIFAALKSVDVKPAQFDEQAVLNAEKAQVQVPAPLQVVPYCHGWTRAARLTKMSMFHPPEHFHVLLPRNSLTNLLERLPQGFQQLSLRVTYVDSPIQAQCQTLEQVEFAVTLLESSEHDQVLLEVQRVAGDCLLFQQYAKQVLEAAQLSKQCCCRPPTCLSLSPPLMQAAESILKHGNRHVSKPPTGGHDDSLMDALTLSQRLVESPCCDARRLGLESLVVLTDPNKAGREQARCVARAVLLGEGAPGASDMQRTVLSLTMNSCWPSSCKQSNDMDVDANDDVFDKDAYLALVCVAQALEAMDNAAATEECLGACRCLGRGDDLVDVLIQKIHDASAAPHQAYYSVKTLSELCKRVPHAVPPRAWNAVQTAQQLGASSHAALESGCCQCLGAMKDNEPAHA